MEVEVEAEDEGCMNSDRNPAYRGSPVAITSEVKKVSRCLLRGCHRTDSRPAFAAWFGVPALEDWGRGVGV